MFDLCSLQLDSTSYKRFIPESLNRTIRQRNFLTRIRINNVFKKFLNDFNRRTFKDSNITMYDLKIKYLATLEGLTRGMGSETFEPLSLSVMQEGDVYNGGYYGESSREMVFMIILIIVRNCSVKGVWLSIGLVRVLPRVHFE